MEKVAVFYKVSKEQFVKDYKDCFPEFSIDEILKMYDEIKLPKRATKGSAGYDFYMPFSYNLEASHTLKVPTGIRCKIKEGWFLAIFPRSGLGFKYRLMLDNTVGIIDEDYYGALNEGHIFIKVTNSNNKGKACNLVAGDGFAQGIFLPFGITEDDNQDNVRTGGFGSTNKK